MTAFQTCTYWLAVTIVAIELVWDLVSIAEAAALAVHAGRRCR